MPARVCSQSFIGNCQNLVELLDTAAKVQPVEELKRWVSLKLKISALQKTKLRKLKDKPQTEKIFTKHLSNKLL